MRASDSTDNPTTNPTASAAGSSPSLHARCKPDKHLNSSGSSSPRAPASPTRPPWDSSPRVMLSRTSMSTIAAAVKDELLQAPPGSPKQGGGSPRHMQSKGSRSKKQHADRAASGHSAQEAAGQPKELIGAVSSNVGRQQQEQQGQEGQVQQQQEREQGASPAASPRPASPAAAAAGKLAAPGSPQPANAPPAAAAAPPAKHAVPKLPLSHSGAEVENAAAAAGWPSSCIQVQPLPPGLLPAVGTSPDLGQAQLDVLGAWYCLYCPQLEAQQAVALARQYDEKASFEDNFVKVFGRDQMGVMYYLLRRCTNGISVAIEKVEMLPGSSSSSRDGGTYQLRIIGRHSFYFPSIIRGPLTSLVLPPALEAWATDTLTVRASDHVVVHHQQRVHNLPTLPWLLRSCLGVSSSLLLMHVLGW